VRDFVLVLSAAVAAGCVAQPGLEGDWAGWAYLDSGGDLPLRVHFVMAGGTPEATLDVPSQGASGLPFQAVTWAPPDLRLERLTSEGNKLVFEGRLRGDTLSGRFDLAGSPADLELHRSSVPLPEVDPAAYADCTGAYRFPDGRTLIVGARFWGELLYTDLESGAHGTLFAESESTFFAGSAMYVPAPISARARFLRDDSGEVEAVDWQETGEASSRAARLAFVEEEVAFSSDGATLAGTLLRTDSPGPHPAIVIIGGSNWSTRGSIRRDAEIFAAFGLSVLIYDKRGFGDSAGQRTVPFEQSARDAVAAVHFLQNRPDVVAEQVGLSGRSRGGWIAPYAASISDDVAFLVLFVAPAVSPAEQETTRRLNAMRDDGFTEAEIAQATELLESTWRYGRSGEGWNAYATAREAALAAGFPEYLFESATEDPEAWEWVRLNMHHDPVPVLEGVDCPVIALFGEVDRNVEPEVNVPLMEQALETAGNEDVELVVVPGANHGLRIVAAGERVPLHRQVGFGPGGWPKVKEWLDARLR
jgi:dienelactone hydrolase